MGAKITKKKIFHKQSKEADASSTNTKVLKPIIKLPKKIINGMVPLQIQNLQKIRLSGFMCDSITFVLSYKFILQSANTDYPNNTWQIKKLHGIDNDNQLWLKVPLFLMEYQFEFSVSVNCTWRHSHPSKHESIVYRINIPSILIDSSIFEIGDKVTYDIENASYVQDGEITRFLEDDMVEIKTDEDYGLPEEDVMVIVHKSKLARDSIEKCFIWDITAVTQAYRTMIIRGCDDENWKFCENLMDFTAEILPGLYVNEYGYPYFNEYDSKWIPMLISSEIYGFLFSAGFNHRVNCVFDGEELYHGQQWSYKVKATYDDYKQGIDCLDAQDCWEAVGYSCDICRCEVSLLEFMWHCQDKECTHDFCLSCVHSMVQQYDEMQRFLMEILNDTLNKDIVEEIVKLCVGGVNKFNFQ